MKIVQYDSGLHEKFVRTWLKARNLSEDLCENHPAIGLIAIHNEVPIAVGFLRQVEGGFGMFDGLCTNPKMESLVRNKAIDMLVDELIHVAKSFEMKAIIAWSVDMGTLIRAERHGFKKMNDQLINLNLSSNLH